MILFKDKFRILRNYFSLNQYRLVQLIHSLNIQYQMGFWRQALILRQFFISDLPKIFFDSNAFKTKIIFYDNILIT